MNNPEHEFLNTALTACRSTISQQETEIKRLKESLDIRNKRITQLEQQIGHASKLFSARTPGTDTSDSMAAVCDKLDYLTEKLSSVPAGHPPNSIVINTCHGHDVQASKQHIATQTQSHGDALDTDNVVQHDGPPQQELPTAPQQVLPTPTPDL